ncbi:MAG: hypothetical protein WC565_03970 [Parcubacteria group bacterium]
MSKSSIVMSITFSLAVVLEVVWALFGLRTNQGQADSAVISAEPIPHQSVGAALVVSTSSAYGPGPGPIPEWESGAGVLQLYITSERRFAQQEADKLRTVFAVMGSRDWAVRVTVVPWWDGKFTTIVNGTTRPSGAAMCAWLERWGRPSTPWPLPKNRTQTRTLCRQYPGPWPMQIRPKEDE